MSDDVAALLGVLVALGVGALAFFKGRTGSTNSTGPTTTPNPTPPPVAGVPVPIPEPQIEFELPPDTSQGDIVLDRAGPDDAPRGIRNNNPGNIEAGIDNWQGAIGDDGRYLVFRAPEWGIRAMGKILINYQRLHEIDTVRGIIDRWAPPFENDTESYIQAVSQQVGVAHNASFDVESMLVLLVPAIIKHENGEQPYDSATIDRGLALI